jgi:hypothetical protein
MNERRLNRSTDREEAIHHLLTAVARAHGDRGIALVDDRGRLLAGSGRPREMWAATRLAQGRSGLDGPGVQERLASKDGTLTLAAIGLHEGPAGLGRARDGVMRILRG